MQEDFCAEYYEIENVHWWFLGRWHVFLNLITKELAERSQPICALDVGCGTGTMLGHLESLGIAVGLDYSAQALQFCRVRGRQHLAQGVASAIPFRNESFDLVCALDLLEHVHDDVAALEELGRVCHMDGCILIAVPAYRFLWGRQDEISRHVRRYTAKELRAKIKRAGLRVRRITYFNALLFPFIATVRVGRRLLSCFYRGELKSDFTMTRPGPLNDFLALILRLEYPLLERASLPMGVSILAIADRPNA